MSITSYCWLRRNLNQKHDVGRTFACRSGASSLEPFLPENAVLLMLGSFPPQKKRWSMDFFYPNLQNDMWRIFGFIFFDDKDYFLSPEKIFDKERIIAFLREKGIALYDTASCVRRLQDNASDKFLEVVSPTDIGLLLQQLPSCRAVVTTGQKATDVFCEQMEAKEPPVEGGSTFSFQRSGADPLSDAVVQSGLPFKA
mgnify:CR=1 FL=1